MKTRIISGTFVFVIITFSLFAAVVSSPVSAEVDYGSTDSKVLENPNVVIRGTSDSDETTVATLLNTLTFSDNVSHWYIVYPDLASATTDGVAAGQVISVTYEGNMYSSVTVFVGNQFDGTGGISTIIADNTTIFFKPGDYSVSAGCASTGYFSFNNLSLIGLGATSDLVEFDMGYYSYGGTDYNLRNILWSNFYASNITFNAQDRSMFYKSTGQHYFHMTGQSNNVFNNVVITNLNLVSSSAENNRNVAINVLNSDYIIFNNVTLEDWTSISGCGPIQVNNSSSNVYFNNLTLNNVHDTQGFIKVEDGTSGNPLTVTSIFITGTLSFVGMTEIEKTIFVESYYYDTVAFPSSLYRYAQVNNQNGSFNPSIPYILLSTTLPDSIEGYAIFDLKDNTFIVKDGDTLITQEQQIQNIVDAVAFIQMIKGMTVATSYNVKYCVGESLGTITLPEVATSISNYDGYWENMGLNIIPVSAIDNVITTKEVVVFNSGSSISLPASNNRYTLFNIDFNEVEGCTLQEVIEGVTPLSSALDPYEYLYGTSNGLTYTEYSSSKSPLVPNATDETFQSCVFTSLVNNIEISSASLTWYVGDEKYLTATLTDTNDNSFTYGSITQEDLNKDTANDEVPIIKWFSTDTSVATVDMDTGKVTAVGIGTVTIVAKAADEYNDGEIEKPWAAYTLVSNPGTYTVTFDSNGGIAADPTTIQVTYGSQYGTLATTSREGYTFDGWYTTVSGGTKIEASSIVNITYPTTLFAVWTLNDYTVTLIYDSEFISVDGVPSGGIVSAGDGISVSVTGSILVEEVYVTVTMGGNTVDVFQYSSGSLTAGTVSIDHVTGDVTITVDYKEVQIVSPSSEKSFSWWILIAIVLILLLVFFLFYRRRKVVFENDSVTVTIDGNPIDSGSKIRKGDILTIQIKANGYRYTVSNATGSDGTYTVDGRRGNVVITSEIDTVQ
ncbi:MAG: InlB B-repeat-containing protein [Candidatus Methanogranum gryphiswaldense]|nr:MAG: InlB B-repeat-containing protein [Candidatus Methanogranum sp. U3.2.1]